MGKEFRMDDGMDGLFAATPPLEALRLLISEAATDDFERNKVISIIDVARAFFEAPVQRDVCIELPEEDLTTEDIKQDLVGKLNMSLYGTRDAAANWQHTVAKAMEQLGFIRGSYDACTYYHPTKGLKTLVHGDDFVTTGHRNNIKWFESKMRERFEVKVKARLGPDPEDDKSVRVLNRVAEHKRR